MMRGTTVLAIMHEGGVVMAADGQVTLGKGHGDEGHGQQAP